MTIQALPYIVLAGLLAGSSLIAPPFGVGQFHPITYISLRLVLASLGHLRFYRRRGSATHSERYTELLDFG